MNLAPLRYARILVGQQGPIERITTARLETGHGPVIQANAWLSRHLNLERSRTKIFGDADGTGTHDTALVARHKAISEAIERWALYFLQQSGNTAENGLETDPTSTGMAAFPGLFSKAARKRARAEAIERFCLVEWWNGTLRSRPVANGETSSTGIEIENPIDRHRVVVLWKQCEGGFFAYGFAGQPSLKGALQQAAVELERSAMVLSRFHLKNPGFELGDLDSIENAMERRVLYFSLQDGNRQFKGRVQASAKEWRGPPPRPVVDMELRGPWSRYATVWRVLYPTQTNRHLRDFANFFFW
jgi:hypothetical protein